MGDGRSVWPTRVGLTLAGILGAFLFLLFLGSFANLWIRPGSFSLLKALVYYGIPAVEVLGLVTALVMGRRRTGSMVRNVLVAMWLAIVLNMCLVPTGLFSF